MNILIPTIGSRGDVQPFIALAQGLKRSGHKVTLASHPVMQALVERYGVPFAPIGPDIDLTQEVAAIRQAARIPALVVPHIADQFYWGQRVDELGVGLKPIRRGDLEQKGLAAALEELVRDEKLREAAARLGEQIRGENGVETAVRLIDDQQWRSTP
jgi:UDP:flavonoid glycosyltransferase YjiC (YdhE family)